jgi:hypothetical protein
VQQNSEKIALERTSGVILYAITGTRTTLAMLYIQSVLAVYSSERIVFGLIVVDRDLPRTLAKLANENNAVSLY